ncbi:MAG: DUF1385 domain-containing protein, partial [Hyphomonadaceae bacterium]|nr:DUF1385 domain-containing protein [Clostridia bacterium]
LAVAVRLPDGTITVDKKPIKSIMQKVPFLKLPILRGVVAFFESMVIGIQTLMYSAQFFDIEDEEGSAPSKFDLWLEKVAGDKLKDYILYFSMILSLFIGVGLFMLLPTALVGMVKRLTTNSIVFNLVEGGVRLSIFVIYIWAISKMKDIQRVFQYHGAEHKTIFCYENGEELTVENVRKNPRLHPRCGTSFLLIVMVVSILLFALLPMYDEWWKRMLTRLALLPLVAGVSYEILKWAGKNLANPFVAATCKPGMWLQKLTTREPDDAQIEVAICALKNVLSDNREDDRWS